MTQIYLCIRIYLFIYALHKNLLSTYKAQQETKI